ncbi:MAG: PilZ domain-containing protein [Candidatus Acidiferrales bacterium]
MEGSSTRTFPRMLLDKPVELEIGEKTIQVENPSNNLSAGGLYVRRGNLPVGTPVHIRIPVDHHFFEADGQIRSCEPGDTGVGIGFDSLSVANRQTLDDLIEELTLRGLPAA